MFGLIFASFLFSQIPQTVTVTGKPAQFVTLSVPELKGDVVKFVCLDQSLSIFPPELLSDRRKTVVVGPKPAKYQIVAYSANLDGQKAIPSEPVIINLTLQDDSAPPDIKPPVYDEILDKLTKVYNPNQKEATAQLSYVLKCSIQLKYEKLSDYNNYLRQNLADIKSDCKPVVSQLVAAEFGTDDVEMTDAMMNKVSSYIIKITTALDKLTKSQRSGK